MQIKKVADLIIENQSGIYGLGLSAESYNGRVRYLRISDIDDFGNLLESDKKSVTTQDEQEYLLKQDDLVVARTGNSTGRTYVYDESDGPMVYAGFLIKFVFDKEKINPRYLKYFTTTDIYKKQTAKYLGSTRGNMSAQDFKNIKIAFPSRYTQDKLVELFDLFNNKVKINNKINFELESMAKTLYNYWFLQFDFPNENGKPYKSSGGKMVWNEELKREIPEGWEVRTVKDCADVVSGYPFKTETYSKDGKYKIYTIGNVQDGYIDDTCPNKIDFIPDDMDRGCILKPCDIIMSLTGNVGRVGLVYTKNALLNQRVLKVEPLEGYHNFLYLLFRNSSFSRVMQRIASGTSQKNLSPNQVCDFKFAIPKKSLLDLFNKKVNGFIKAIVNNLSQNQELTSLRDFLLPLLMNGQVKFKD